MYLFGIPCRLFSVTWEKEHNSINRLFFHTFLQSHNDFVAILDLPEGEHQYKFFVDGQWVHDISEVRSFNMSLCFKTYCFLLFMFIYEACQSFQNLLHIMWLYPLQPTVTSELGTINNLIQVKKSDFEVFDALQVDSLECSDTSGETGFYNVTVNKKRSSESGYMIHSVLGRSVQLPSWSIWAGTVHLQTWAASQSPAHTPSSPPPSHSQQGHKYICERLLHFYS